MRILIVDDDVQIREGITEGIDWNSLGIEEVQNCSDGVAALELFQTFCPDIILADVRMPQMDGLEFLKRIKSLNSEVKVIMISGYSDFEYLKCALQYGAEDYELKPIKVRNLIKLINKTKEKIIKERYSKAKVDEYQNSYEKNFIGEVIRGEINDPNVIAGYFQPKFKTKDVKIVICGILGMECKLNEQIDFSAGKKIILEYFKSVEEDLMCFYINEKEFLLIMPALPSSLYVYNQQNKMKLCCLTLKEKLRKEGITISLGVSLEVNISFIRQGYELARCSLEERIYDGRESIHIQTVRLVKEVTDKESQSVRSAETERVLRDLLPEISDAYLLHNISLVEEILIRAKQAVKDHCVTNMKMVLEFILNSCIQINNSYIKKGDKEKPFLIIAIHEELEQCIFLDDYIEYANKIFRQALEDEQKKIQQKYSLPIAKAVSYIQTHYVDNLTAEFMSDYIEKTPNYFSHLFKKEAGVSFKEYLNMIRIQKARELLSETDLKIYEVAELVGYRDSIYFSQAFKKAMGYSPAECRRR